MNMKVVKELNTIFHFNPTSELAIANGLPNYLPPALLREFEEELATIMLFFAVDNDFVIKENPVNEFFLKQLKELNFPKPVFISKTSLKKHIPTVNKLLHFESWGKSPAESNFINDIKAVPNSDWDPVYKKLYNRKTSISFLENFLKKHYMPVYPSLEFLPQEAQTIEEIQSLITKWGSVVLKTPLSSSGRGLQIIRKKDLNHANIKWINSVLLQQNYLTVEKWYSKYADISFQFHISNEHVNCIGPTFFQTNTNGQYSGHYLNFTEYGKLNMDFSIINKTGELLQKELSNSIYAKTHQGFLGIDAIIFSDKDLFKLHPCIEINPRYTMGMVSKQIEKYLHHDAKGNFRIYYDSKKPFLDFIADKQKKHEIIMSEEKLKKGIIALTSPNPDSKFGAYIELL